MKTKGGKDSARHLKIKIKSKIEQNVMNYSLMCFFFPRKF
jgi:hypothetical protein